jgi:hypothetical protein
LAKATSLHCSTLQPQMTCLVYLQVLVARITGQHEDTLTLRISCLNHITSYQPVPKDCFESIVSMPWTNWKYVSMMNSMFLSSYVCK